MDGHQVPVPHVGLVLSITDFHELAGRLRAGGIEFVIEPYLQFAGQAGDQPTMFLRDRPAMRWSSRRSRTISGVREVATHETGTLLVDAISTIPDRGAEWEHNLALNCSLLRQTALNIRELAARDLRLYAFCLVRGSGWTVTDTLLLGSFHRPSTMLDTA